MRPDDALREQTGLRFAPIASLRESADKQPPRSVPKQYFGSRDLVRSTQQTLLIAGRSGTEPSAVPDPQFKAIPW